MEFTKKIFGILKKKLKKIDILFKKLDNSIILIFNLKKIRSYMIYLISSEDNCYVNLIKNKNKTSKIIYKCSLYQIS